MSQSSMNGGGGARARKGSLPEVFELGVRLFKNAKNNPLVSPYLSAPSPLQVVRPFSHLDAEKCPEPDAEKCPAKCRQLAGAFPGTYTLLTAPKNAEDGHGKAHPLPKPPGRRGDFPRRVNPARNSSTNSLGRWCRRQPSQGRGRRRRWSDGQDQRSLRRTRQSLCGVLHVKRPRLSKHEVTVCLW